MAHFLKNFLLVFTLLVLATGCTRCRQSSTYRPVTTPSPNGLDQLVASCGDGMNQDFGPMNMEEQYFAPPLTSADQLPTEQYPLTLDEAVTMALRDTTILRGLGAQILQSPQSMGGVLDPALQWLNPNTGIEAALAQFDADSTFSLNYANNDDVFNNSVVGGGASEVQQDLTTATFGLSKVSATGTQYSFRGNLEHDNNDRPGNRFGHSWTSRMEAEVRHPLLQGRGVLFNRIAGPATQAGFRFSNGVLISQINQDISQVQFEGDVQQFVSEVVNAYWRLYFAYKNFESSKQAWESSLETWNIAKARYDSGLPGGEADKESQAKEQVFIFENRMLSALNGDRRTGTTGVLQAEAELRQLLDLPQSDGRLVVPTDAPTVVEMVYDWDALASTALQNRVELREQMARIKQRHFELIAARNFRLPRLDAVATYRNNGFGDDLLGGNTQYSSAGRTALRGDYDEFEVGLQMNVPIGYRQASAGVKFAQLQLSRDNSLLKDQQKHIMNQLGSAVRQAQHAFEAAQISGNRLAASQETVDAREASFEAESVPFDQLLDAQQRLADAKVDFAQRQVDFAMALEAVSRESGQLLTEHGVFVENHQVEAMPVQQKVITKRKVLDYRLKLPSLSLSLSEN